MRLRLATTLLSAASVGLLTISAMPAAAATSTATPAALTTSTSSDLGYDLYLVTGISSTADVQKIAATGASVDAVEPDLVHVTATPSEVAAIQALGFTVQLVQPPTTSDVKPPDNFPSPDTAYHTYSEMVSDINAVATQYPGLVQVSVFGHSYEGRNLYAIKISDNVAVDEPEPEVLYDAHMHAREHITVEMALYLLHMFTEQYNTDPRVRAAVDSREIWILPDMNPDGGEFDVATGSPVFWRKDRQPNSGTTAVGTDINRNFGYQWGCCQGSSGDPTSEVYRGPSAFSTPEAKALQSFIQGRRIGGVQQIKAAIDFHSYSELVLWPYSYTRDDTATGLNTDQQATFRAIGQKMAATNGYTPAQASDGVNYTSDGSSTDYMWAVEGIWAYAFEMYPKPDNAAGFYPSDSVIPTETARNRDAALLLAEYADCPYRAIGKAEQYCPQPTVSAGFQTSFSNAADGLVWEASASDTLRRSGGGLAVAAGTNPAIAALSTMGRVIAFHSATTETLWIVDNLDAARDTGVKMAAGSSPAIVALPNGGYDIVFASSDNLLRQVGPDGVVRWVANGLGLAPGTTPAVAAGPRGGIEIAFHAWGENTLWTVTPDNVGHDTGLAMMANSSPAVTALPNGTYEIAFADSARFLRELGPDGVANSVVGTPAVADSTSPAIAALASGGFQVAMQAGIANHTVFTVTSSGTVTDTGVYAAAGTSPNITALPVSGYQIAVHEDGSNHLVTFGTLGKHAPGQTLSLGTSPTIASARVGQITGYASKCVDVAGGSPINGTQVQLWTCNGGGAQRWFLSPDATVRALNKCLDVSGGGSADGTKVQIWDCNGTGAQVWQPTGAGELRNPQSGKCLDVTGASSSDGTRLQIYTCTGGANQKWILPSETSGILAATPPPPPTVVTVPTIVGMSISQAQSTLTSVGLNLGNETDHATTNCDLIGVISGQNPSAGTQVLAGSSVNFDTYVLKIGASCQ